MAKNILICDDAAFMRMMIKDILTKNGYNVEVSHWNSEKQAYDLPSEVTLYRSQAPNLTTVKTYKMNEKQDNMYLTSSMVVMEPIENSLLAIR